MHILGPGEHVDQGDIMFRECEEETEFNTSGNMNNPNCQNNSNSSPQPPEGDQVSDATSRSWLKWPLPVAYEIDGSLGG